MHDSNRQPNPEPPRKAADCGRPAVRQVNPSTGNLKAKHALSRLTEYGLRSGTWEDEGDEGELQSRPQPAQDFSPH
jgi:hypothetical protein